RRLERIAGKLARAVPRGLGGSNPTWLLDGRAGNRRLYPEADCLQRPVRRSSACSIPITDGKEAEEILGSTADLNPKGRGDQSLPTPTAHGAQPRIPWRG